MFMGKGDKMGRNYLQQTFSSTHQFSPIEADQVRAVIAAAKRGGQTYVPPYAPVWNRARMMSAIRQIQHDALAFDTWRHIRAFWYADRAECRMMKLDTQRATEGIERASQWIDAGGE